MSTTDSPPPAPPISEGAWLLGARDDIDAKTVVHNGRPVTVVRDKATGNIIYPAPIPEQAKAPTVLNGAGTERSATDLPERPSSPEHVEEAGQGVRRTATEDQAGLKNDHGKEIGAPAWSSSSSSSSDSDSDSDSDEESFDQKKHKAQPHRLKRKQATAQAKDKHRPKTTKHAHHGQKEADDEERYRRFRLSNEQYRTKGKVSKRDGRLAISLFDTSAKGYLVKALGTAVKKVAPGLADEEEAEGDNKDDKKTDDATEETAAQPFPPPTSPPPRLNIVIMVIGSRGDVQPFVRIAQLLHNQYHHRVRIATHPAFREMVATECGPGVEFFSVGGDPSELMAFMVKNPGMIPTLDSLRAGDVGRRRRAMADMFQGFWRACINATDDERDARNVNLMGEHDPFVADAIIANPPSFAHVHCAEALGIPLHLMFTFPYTPTQSFPHPLASVKKSNADPGYTNWISYALVDMMVWQGLGDLVNEFRTGTLGLDTVSTLWAPGATYRLHVPFTYLISPGLMPKPADWGEEVDVAGFVFLDQATAYKPPEELVKFLDACPEGEPPVYIGFGSIVVDDPDRFTQMIFEAVKKAGVRALVSKGWGGLGGNGDGDGGDGEKGGGVPEDVFLLDTVPHDWLFPRVRACVIHGGAGTSAMALKCGKPTMVVPFFGDQYFWGSMIGKAGAGPEPVPHKHLTVDRLAEGIRYCLTDEAREAAQHIARDIAREGDGAENACRAFHRGLRLHGHRSMRCALLPDQVAVWQTTGGTRLRLSALAAEILVRRGLLSWKKLRLLRHCEWNDFEGPGEPLTGAAGSLASSIGKVFTGVGGVPYRVGKSVKRRRERKKKAKENGQATEADERDSASTNINDNNTNNSTASPNSEPPQVETSTTHAIDHNDIHPPPTTPSPASEATHHAATGAAKTASALARTPADLILAVGQGFHNAPRLYGDETVRRPTRVTGIRSGLRAARRELGYGVYDGWTGVVRHPVRGARENGVRGFASGVGMGVTGFVLKNLAALFGAPGYALKGVVKQVGRRKRPVRYIRRARVMQGQRERGGLEKEEREKKRVEEKAVEGWKVMGKLLEEMRRAEKKREEDCGLGERVDRKARRLRRRARWSVVFEDVGVAESALAELRAGRDLDSILDELDGRS
ncbi:hypothetical protein VTJ04DRAFT_2347 [Mycothermus thermophilus]|uniref:uncharacterized protein n=1 Tax=Humicola insolens TaxID=85995 RepID=UPI003743A03F